MTVVTRIGEYRRQRPAVLHKGAQSASPEVPNLLLNRYVTQSQAEAIELLLLKWDREELLPGVLDALQEDLESALDSGLRTALWRVAGMADGLILILGEDARLRRIRERAESLAQEIGRD